MIRPMLASDAESVISMMETFYASPAVHTNGSAEIFRSDVEECLSPSPYLEGFVFEEDGTLLGYAMVAKSFSTEFGKKCMWLEDLYLRETARGRGLGRSFLSFLAEKYPQAILRLEVEEENEPAVHVYRKSGFQVLPYMEMVKL